MNSVNPLASVLIGVAVLDERPRTGPIPSTVEAFALAAMTKATVPAQPRAETASADLATTGAQRHRHESERTEPYAAQHQPRRKTWQLRIVRRPPTPAQLVPPCWR